MRHFQLASKLDFGLFHDIEESRYGPEAQDRIGIDKRLFCKLFSLMPSVGFTYDNEPIGGGFLFRDEFHMAVLPQFHGRWAVLWPATLEWLFAHTDPVVAKLEKSNPVVIAFAQRNAFPMVREDDRYVYFEMTRQRADILTRHNARRRRINVPMPD
jgi:hypothetical protein